MRDLMLEVRSWINWLYRYRFPCWISAPFQFSVFKILYSLVTGLLILIIIPSGIQRDFLEQSLNDLWIKTVGENSLAALKNLLNSFPYQWTYYLFEMLIIWGVVVWIWAWKQANYFKVIKELGITIVRGPGKRWLFIERLKKEGISALGYGPTGELLDIYFPCHEDQLLREKLLALSKNRTNILGLIIAGPAASGKTRIAMELIANSWDSLVFIWSKTIESRNWSNVPEWKGSAIVVVDNVDLSQKAGGIPLPATLQEFLLKCRKVILVGTVRKQYLPADHRMLEVVELSPFEREELLNFAVALAKLESEKGRKRIGAADIMSRYNGYPAGLVAGFDEMRAIYEGLALEMRSFLQAARTLWEMGVQVFTLERVWEANNLLIGSEMAFSQRSQILDVLMKHGFVSMRRQEQQWIEIYEGYLDEVFDLPHEYETIERKIMVLWERRGDAAAFIERGNFLTEIYSPGYQNNPRGVIQLGIAAYEKALEIYTPEHAPLDYARTQNNLGTAYLRLAGYEDPLENLRCAVVAFEKALKFRIPEHAPLDYARTQNNLGNVYLRLAGYEDPLENLRRAVVAFEKALKFRTPECALLDYARTQNNLGTAYSDLAGYENPLKNLRRAVEACEKALKIHTPECAPLDYAGTQNNLGNAYLRLAGYEDPLENLRRVVVAYEKALEIYTPERAPLDYARTQNNLGIARMAQSRICKQEYREEYLNKAKDAFLIYEEKYPGKGSYNLACIHALLLNENECRGWLENGKKLNTLPGRDHIEHKADLDLMREKPWFVQFLNELE